MVMKLQFMFIVAEKGFCMLMEVRRSIAKTIEKNGKIDFKFKV